MPRLRLLSGGAAQGVVHALTGPFRAATGYDIDGTFSAVGAMRDALLAGEPADLVILTRKLVDELAASGHVVAGSGGDLGAVLTGVAVRAGDPAPAAGDADSLRASLLAADGVYFPDPERATAGIHFAGVLERLGVAPLGKVRRRGASSRATPSRSSTPAKWMPAVARSGSGK